jgi:hypothetical protein
MEMSIPKTIRIRKRIGMRTLSRRSRKGKKSLLQIQHRGSQRGWQKRRRSQPTRRRN